MKGMLTGKDWLTHTSDRLWHLSSEQRWDVVSLDTCLASKGG